MQNITEIKDLLERLNPRERKAAKKYFSIHFENTKELQLFNLIEASKGRKKFNLENRICKLGYESSESKSFQKLKTRLKHKLYDFLSTSVSISEIKSIDSHSFLVHRIKKGNFQAGVLIEKGFFVQANEVLRTSLRLAQDYQQIPEIIESLKCLNRIEKLQCNINRQESLTEKIKYFLYVHQQINQIESRFNNILSSLELQSMDQTENRIKKLLKDISEDAFLLGYDKIQMIKSYLEIQVLQSEENYYEAFSKVVKIIRLIQTEGMRYEVQTKMLFYTSLIELLLITGHYQQALHFLNGKEIQSKPIHLKQRLYTMYQHFVIGRSEQILGQEYHCIDGKYQLVHEYLKAHQYFNLGNIKKTMECIDVSIRKFSIQSLQQLDLMVLEMMCFYDLNQFDLLDYKLQSFLKNLAYRGQYDVPAQYHQIYKVLNIMLRSRNKDDWESIKNHKAHLESMNMNGLFIFRSLQPKIFITWMDKKLKTKDGQNKMLTLDLPSSILHLNQVA